MNFVLLFIANFAFAQGTFDGLQTGRYELHKGEKQSRSVATKEKKTPNRKIASETETVQKSSPSIEAKKIEAPQSIREKTSISAEEKKEEPSIVEQVQSLASGDAGHVYDFYREQVHPDDIRNNRVEIEVSPGFVSNESKSNYSYRDYKSSFQALSLDGNIWFTPLVGISGRYMFSFAADVSGDTATRSKVPASYEFIDLSLNFRKFLGLSRTAKSVEFEFLYSDYKMKTEADNAARGRVSTSGIGLGFKSRLPSSADYAWTVGGSFFPKLQHTESSTGLNLSSGHGAESARIGVELGGEFKFSRESQLIWTLGFSSEKNLFSGLAGAVDTATGTTPENVSVTNTLLMFNLGYRWGQ